MFNRYHETRMYFRNKKKNAEKIVLSPVIFVTRVSDFSRFRAYTKVGACAIIASVNRTTSTMNHRARERVGLCCCFWCFIMIIIIIVYKRWYYNYFIFALVKLYLKPRINPFRKRCDIDGQLLFFSNSKSKVSAEHIPILIYLSIGSSVPPIFKN